jgi:spermidine synthase
MAQVTTAAVPRVDVPRRSAGLFPVLCLLFFASGACGLVYQQLWLRQLSLVFGVTIHAVSTVLAAFFGGLAVGAVLAGRWARRTKRPLHWYGVAEIVIGVLAVLTPAGLRAVERIYVSVAGVLPDGVGGLTAVRFVLSFVVLLIPATLMGATLPLVVSSSAVRGPRVGERVGVLYATNTAGAITGTLAAGFWMIGQLGVVSSFRIAASVNVIVGLVAIASSRWYERDPIAPDAVAPQVTPLTTTGGLSQRDRRLLLWVFAVSGFVSLALEVVWFRVLVLYVETDTYAFTIILAVVLTGIAAGGYLAAGVLHRWGPRLVQLAVIELAIAVTALTSFAFLSKSFTVNGRFGEVFSPLGEDVRFVIVAGVLTVAPTALLLGVAFPIGLALWTRGATNGAETARRVGTFYSINVAAGIAGSLAAGFVLVPLAGTRATLIVLAIALLGSGLVLVWALPRSAGGLRPVLAVGGVLAVIVAAVVAVPHPFAAALTYRYPGHRVLWYDEGAQTTVSIHEPPEGIRAMYLDGLHQANSSPAMVSFHGLIGTLALAVHPDPQRALVVGLGGGVTAGALSDDAQLRVEVIELSSEVVEGAQWLAAVNGDVTNRANVDVRIDDGRNFLLTTERRYDVITADLIQPEHAGAGKLWSVEYWRLARDALAPGGMMVQWVPTARARDHSMITRSFLEVFPHVTAWAGGNILVGSAEPLVIDAGDYTRRLAEPGTGASLAAAGMGSVDQLRAMYTAGRDELQALVGEGPLLTDDQPRLEFWRSGGPGRDIPPDLAGLHGDANDVIEH